MKMLNGFVHKKLNSSLVTAAALLMVSLFIIVACQLEAPTRSMVIDYDLTPFITPPETGKHPNYTPFETDQYSGTLTWRKDDGIEGLDKAYQFEADTIYKAYITLKVKDPWTFFGVGEDVFHVQYESEGKNPADLDITSVNYNLNDTDRENHQWVEDPRDKANVIIIFAATAPYEES
jgi:hypothetical protein